MPDVTRRAVLAAGGLTVAATALRPATASAATLPGRSTFEDAVGSKVTIRTAATTVRATVTEVTDIVGGSADDPQRYAIFLRPSTRVPDGIVRVTGSRLGSATLFFSNVDRNQATALQAVVNTTKP
jgi:hypothetical protein